ncbi:hypothetical protein RHGRI_017883 [Rhododendron griersonianum]|uniref:GAG-pre-integrase domain-containing protein n=1 Tax=Rhododendron griersonianum TaxID=479676 RepID=A0AAV6JZC0_9ERIC|nr:hypothetical protein RHGRI_017883 [Rhododendron griersonianum]
MDRSEASQPISVTLDGTNFVLWAQAMSSFLKGKKLWRVITGEVIKPTRGATESQDKYGERLEEWDSKNHQIITWIRNTSVTSINLQFGRFQDAESPAKEIWEFLKERYNTTGLAHQVCKHCHKTGPRHRQYDCPKNPYKQSHPSGNPYKQSNHSGNPYKQSNYYGNSLARGGQNKPHYQFKPSSTSRTAAAAAEGSSSDMPSPPEHYVPSISMHDLESILKQVSSHFGTPSTALSVTSGISSWFFDSACCNHMTSDSTIFSPKSTSSSMPVIHTADGSHMHVSHVGHVSTPNVSLPDSYLIPALTLNLISVGQLCELGLTVLFSPSGCQVQDPHTGQTIGIGRRTGRLFELISLHLPPRLTSPVQSAASASSISSLSLWHSRLGHVSVSRLRSLVSSGSLHTSFPQPIPDASVLPADSAPASSGSSLSKPPESSPNNDVTVPPPLRRSDRAYGVPLFLYVAKLNDEDVAN